MENKISEQGLDNCITEIREKIEKIKADFDKMESMIDDSASYVKSDVGKTLRNKFSEISDSFPNVILNLETIVLELEACKKNYIKQNEEAAILLNDYVD